MLPTTEQRNPASYKIDTKSTLEILQIINNEDKKVPVAVEQMLPTIASLVDDIVVSFNDGGRLFYIGAGTSGRLGVLDASECPPTFGVPVDMVQGLIAGGIPALTSAVESAEDDFEAGVTSLKAKGFSKKDVLVGITASGQAPYVIGAMVYAKELGSTVGAISCNEESQVFCYAKHKIFLSVGQEIITGSTRMKSGTAQKLVLNMLTTAAMIRIGKVYNNLMVDLMPLNAKLVDRAKRLIDEITDCGPEKAAKLYAEANGNVKIAIIMSSLQITALKASELLGKNAGSINRVLDSRKIQ
ncbi:N-acetylmuramic acid 6-phosphate etherase [uncultured Sphaerochaeta sp.]|uniref:N-acetylmuramic acid 6-phosphate etherase n=1 Tax=uncultured Sphaerochaeta sp. TaxID=886478 RepID=UPI002A0A2A27|nr:N-acetylmuramic acid 6-phosphate etherase [uncultured Sphaerochaeta sp.]